MPPIATLYCQVQGGSILEITVIESISLALAILFFCFAAYPPDPVWCWP